MKLSETKQIYVKKYDELSVKGMYDDLMKLQGVADYFPSKYPKGRQCDRDYMWNISNSLHESTIKGIIEHALR